MRKSPAIKDPRGGHIRLYHEIFDSPAYRCLSATDQRAYLGLHRQLMSFNNGDLSLPFSRAKHYGITNESTLAKNLRALCAVGLIAITRRASHRRDGSREPHLYRVTDLPVFEQPGKRVDACNITNDWRKVTSLAIGRALIKQAESEWSAEWAGIKAQRDQRRAAEK